MLKPRREGQEHPCNQETWAASAGQDRTDEQILQHCPRRNFEVCTEKCSETLVGRMENTTTTKSQSKSRLGISSAAEPEKLSTASPSVMTGLGPPSYH